MAGYFGNGMGLFNGGGFGGLGMGGQTVPDLFMGTGATGGIGGQALTPDMIMAETGAGTKKGSMSNLYNEYGTDQWDAAFAGLDAGQQAKVGGIADSQGWLDKANGQSGNFAGNNAYDAGSQGLFSQAGDILGNEQFNNAARTGGMLYFGNQNLKNAQQGLDYMGQQQAQSNDQYATNKANAQQTEQLNF